MSIESIQLKLRKNAFLDSCHLVKAMEDYSRNPSEQSEKVLSLYAQISKGIPLPSGRWGNAIALALEINDYISAEYLIDHAKELELETNTVVSELGGKNAWPMKDEYLFSQLTYESSEKGILLDFYSKEEVEQILQKNERQKEAMKRLESKLSVTEEDRKLIKNK